MCILKLAFLFALNVILSFLTLLGERHLRVPRLCLGTHCLAGSACRIAKHSRCISRRGRASGAVRSQAEPRNEKHNWWRLARSVSLLAISISIGCNQSHPPSAPASSVIFDENIKDQTVVVDRLNRTIRFTKVPRRIVSLLPSTTELMFAIGAGHQMVGSTDHCNYPVAAKKLTRIGGGMLHDISRETILSLNPDLILCKWDSQQPLIEPFDRLNIPVVSVGSDSLTELIGEATLLGRVTGHEAEASSLIENMKRRLVALTSLVDSIPMERRRRTFYEVWDEPLMTAGPKSFIGELMEMGGMKNIFSDTLVGYPKISEEVVLDRDPEVILAPSTHRSKVSLEILAKRQGWDRITAVRDRQVFLIDGDQVSRCGPRMLDALEEMIRAVYPDMLPKVGAREQPGEGADR